MKIIKPEKLKKGDLIGVISPASAPKNIEDINKGVEYLKHMEYDYILGKNVGKEHGYLAGSDEERLDDLHEMFKNKDVKAIFCARGGYGSGRLLDRIDYNLIKKNPKIFIGYSDITAMQMAIFKKTGLITFAGPMVASDFAGEVNSYAEENFWKVLTSSKKIGKVHNPRDEKFFVLKNGRGEGKILGGNLAVLVSLLGTEYAPNFKDSILLIEEIGEDPYKVDRFLNQLKLSGILKQVNGVILGRFVDCYVKDKSQKTIKLNEVIEHYFGQLNIPVFYSFSHGHIKENITIPFGCNCKINSSRGFIEITENGVI